MLLYIYNQLNQKGSFKNATANLEITTVIGCSLSCEYCPQKKFVNQYTNSCSSKKFDMTLDDFKSYLSTVPKRVDIHFSGMSEPWLNKDCTEMVKYANDKGHRVSVFTTLVGMTEKDYLQIKDIPFKNFMLHLPDNNNITKLKVTDEYKSLLTLVIKNRPQNFDTMSLSDDIDKSIKNIVGSYYKSKKPELVDRAGNIDSLNKNINIKGNSITCAKSGYLLNKNVLLPDGRVLLCCMDYGMQNVIGNLSEMSYQDLFFSDSYKRIRFGFDDPSIELICRKCSKCITI